MFIKMLKKGEEVEVIECFKYLTRPIPNGARLLIYINMDNSAELPQNYELKWGKECPYVDIFVENSDGKTVNRLFSNRKKAA